MKDGRYPFMRAFGEMLIEHMSRGHSFESFSAEIRYPFSMVNAWLHEKPSFAEAKKIGEKARLKALETLLLTKQINLETFQYLVDNEDTEIEQNVHNFDDSVLVAAQERFNK